MIGMIDEGKHMDCMRRINSAMDYIESHMTEDIDYHQVARRACCSVYHFQRMFSFVTGIPPSEYIRRRRLTMAAFDLCGSDAKIIDIAAKYGYKSPEAFSRAFKSLHGVMPTAARNASTALKAYPRLSFSMSLGGDMEISYRIIHKQAHEVCGLATEVLASSEQTNTLITHFWEENIKSGVLGQFHRDIGLAYDVCVNAALFNYRPNMFTYMICYEAPPSGTPAGYATLSIPPLTWAVFSTPEHLSKENTTLIRLMRERIFLEWFPTSGYEPAIGPEFEIFKTDREKFVVEIWIPISRVGFH